MKAITHTRYGPPEVLQLTDVEKPTPDDNQVLVQVHAVSLNPAEAHMRRGMLLARLVVRTGLFRPTHPILGADFAGRVEAVGKNVTGFRPGDRVFGRRGFDGFAEYVCASGKVIALMPPKLTFEQAAAVPVAALTALQSIRDTAKIEAGRMVLINGAAGGVGTFAVQIARAFGAQVTGVCSTQNVELVRSLGAQRVIDYTQEDFTRDGQQYDVIVDNVGNRSVADCARALRPNGLCVGVGFSSIRRLIEGAVMGPIITRLQKKTFTSMLAHVTPQDLVVLADMLDTGRVVPVVDRCYPLTEVAKAYRYLETRHARGKVIVTFPVTAR